MSSMDYSSLDGSGQEVSRIYLGGFAGYAGDDPITRRLPGAGNMGGIRTPGRQEKCCVVDLFTTGKDPDWADRINCISGNITNFGGIKDPFKDLQDPNGNQALRVVSRLLKSWRDSGTYQPLLSAASGEDA